jgi:signal transduction histidine kinase
VVTLRAKLLALFLLLGVAPLLALGVLSYVRSTRALEGLLEARTRAIASRASEALFHRYTRAVSDLQYLADNAETQRLLTMEAGAEGGFSESDHADALSFLDAAWGTLGSSWRWAELRTSGGALVHRFGAPTGVEVPGEEGRAAGGVPDYVVLLPVLDVEGRAASVMGSVRGSLLVQEVLPRNELAAGFGESGYSIVVDRARMVLLFHPRRTAFQQSLSSLLGPEGWDVDVEVFDTHDGGFSYSEGGMDRVASFTSLADPPWTIISSESLQEFVAPFAQTGLFNLLVVLLVTGTVSVAFVFLTRRATDSLRRLTTAADEVAAGNLDPPLPPGAGDEVGRLSAAFSIMVGQVRTMLRRVEESRHMSAIGEFTAQLSHEVRNPLTSIKLNLQRLERGVEDSRIPAEYAKAVAICLREVKRLDTTVRGVLSISRTRPPRSDPESLHAAIRAALEVVSPHLEQRGVLARMDLSAREDTVLGDRELLEGAFLNLFLNAVEAMAEGGTLRVTTRDAPGRSGSGTAVEDAPSGSFPGIVVEISDEGQGIPEELRERIFDPFFTTKDGGTGFGLPLAARVMEEHAGTLRLADPSPARGGATFLVELPVVASEVRRP